MAVYLIERKLNESIDRSWIRYNLNDRGDYLNLLDTVDRSVRYGRSSDLFTEQDELAYEDFLESWGAPEKFDYKDYTNEELSVFCSYLENILLNNLEHTEVVDLVTNPDNNELLGYLINADIRYIFNGNEGWDWFRDYYRFNCDPNYNKKSPDFVEQVRKLYSKLSSDYDLLYQAIDVLEKQENIFGHVYNK